MSTELRGPGDRSADGQGWRPGRRTARGRRTLLLTALGIVIPAVLLGAVAIKGLDAGEPSFDAGTAIEIRTGDAAGGDTAPARVIVGAPVPPFEVATLAGGTFRMPSAQPTVLLFIDLCPTCIGDVRTIGELHRAFGNVAVLAVASDPTADAARLKGFVQQAGDVAFALALDPQSTLTLRFDAFSMAGSVVVTDPGGTVTYRGPADRAALEAALREAGATA